MKLVMWTAVAALLMLPGTAFAGSEQQKQPEAGGSRMIRLFPRPTLQKLPDKAWEHGVPQVLYNVQKNPRNAKSGNARNP